MPASFMSFADLQQCIRTAVADVRDHDRFVLLCVCSLVEKLIIAVSRSRDK
jgi:hypothetical protein